MIKLPKEVSSLIRALDNAGIENYLAGRGVAMGYIGEESLDWDLIAFGEKEDIKEVINGFNYNEFNDYLRVDFDESSEDDLPIIDIFCLQKHISDDTNEIIKKFLKRYIFNVIAFAFHPNRGDIDPFDGRGAIRNRLIDIIDKNDVEILQKKPISMMKIILFAAEYDFDLSEELYNIIVENSSHLQESSVDEIRETLKEILVTPHTGKGLRLLAGTNLMPSIIGDVATQLNFRQRNQFATVCDGIDKTQPVLLRRLGLFYACFEEKKGKIAIEKLDYDSKTKQHLMDAILMMDKLHFIKLPEELKDFLVKVGMDRYEYMDNLSKAQRICFDGSENKILSRYYMLKEIYQMGEPIWIEDLAIGYEDLEESLGLVGEDAHEMLILLTDVVHRKPKDNNYDTLLKYAKKFNKSAFAKAIRKVKWLR